MTPFTVLILFAFALGALGFIDEETELYFEDELSSSEDVSGRIGELEGKIIGGNDARPGQFPHQVSLHGFMGFFCGGSILNRLFVLTAAHCTQNSHPGRVSVFVGSLRRNEGTRHRVHSIYNHPGYVRENITNDIAIIRTVDDIAFDTRYVRPVRLPIFNVPEAGNYSVYVSGWGHISNAGRPAVTLQFKDTLTLNRQECIARIGNGRYVHENVLCVQNPHGRGVCYGDSGSALISQRGVQVGIASWVVPPCARGYPDGYVNVWSHIEWIRATIRANWNSTQLE